MSASMRLFIVIVISVQSCSLGYFVIAYVAAVTYLAVHNKNNARNVGEDFVWMWKVLGGWVKNYCSFRMG